MISIIQLEAFVCVVKEGSISRAAEKLFLSQPTISTHIGTLEKELRTKLFFRTSRGVSLTEKGEVFYCYARDILSQISNAVNDLNNQDEGISGHLTLASSTAPAEFVLPSMLAAFHKEYPDIRITVTNCRSAEVVKKIGIAEVDVGIVGAHFSSYGCEYLPFCCDRLVLIAPAQEPYTAFGGDFPLALLQTLPFVGRLPGSGTRKQYEGFLSAIGIDYEKMNVVCELDSTEGVKRAVKSGMGVSLLSVLSVQQEEGDRNLIVQDIDHPSLQRQFSLVWRKTTCMPAQTERFLSFAKKYVDSLQINRFTPGDMQK